MLLLPGNGLLPPQMALTKHRIVKRTCKNWNTKFKHIHTNETLLPITLLFKSLKFLMLCQGWDLNRCQWQAYVLKTMAFFLFFLGFLQKGNWDSWQEDGRLERGRQWVACNSWMLYRIGSYPRAHEPARRSNRSFKESSPSLPTDANTTQCCCRLILNACLLRFFSHLFTSFLLWLLELDSVYNTMVTICIWVHLWLITKELVK